MRHPLVISVILWISATAIAAEKPIPQDPARSEKRQRDRLDWNRRTIVESYDKVGAKNPRWDKSAREALELAARMFSLDLDQVVTLAEIYTPAKAAIDAGCDDPMVVYLYHRASRGSNYPGDEEASRRLTASAMSLASSRYPAIRRAIALQLAGNLALTLKTQTPELRKDAERDLDAALALLTESAAQEERSEFWEERWFDTLIQLINGYRKLGSTGQRAYTKVDDALAKIPALEVLRLQIRGEFWLHYGWEARTTAFAADVPPRGFETLEKRLVIARTALEAAWKLRPGDPLTANALLGIEKSIGGDRATMELWFDRAMKAEGDNFSACWSKLDWLDPKWHGTLEEMVAFGRACRDTKNWRAQITLLGADAHDRVASLIPGDAKAIYLRKSEVWSDIKSIYDDYLKHRPDDEIVRSKYAMTLFQAHHFDEAHNQFEILGDRLTQWPSSPFFPLEVMKKSREETARYVLANRNQIHWTHRQVNNDEGHWTADFPGDMERKQEPGILGTKNRNLWACTRDGATYAVRVQLIPASLRAGPPNKILDAARAATAEEKAGQPRDEHAVTVSDNIANEYFLEAPALKPKVLRIRSTVIGNRLYELSVTATEAEASGKVANQFLDSFKFQK